MSLSKAGLGLVALIVYLSFHALAGEQGLVNWMRMQGTLDELTERREALAGVRDDLLRDTSRLAPSSLDLDYVEEAARRTFVFARPDEYVLVFPSEAKKDSPAPAPARVETPRPQMQKKELADPEDLFALSKDDEDVYSR